MAKQRTAALGPWPAGINNTARDYRLPKGACIDALNVDFTDEGDAIGRTGYGQTTAIDSGHSLRTIGGKTFLCLGTSLGVVTAVNPLTVTTLRTGLDLSLPISYAERGGEVWWSNGVQSGRCGADNSDHPMVPPSPANLSTVFPGVGTLRPGVYRLAITHAMSDGEESVASEIYAFTLTEAGSIIITLPAATAGTDAFNVYCSTADSSVLQKYATVSAATASIEITTAPVGRQLRDRAFLRPMPAGALCFHGARLLSMVGETIYYSAPYDYGVHNPDEDYIILGDPGNLLVSVESGVFVAADRTWFYSGTDIKTAEPVEKLAFGAVSGTVFEHPDTESPAAGWFSQDGMVLGGGDGSVTLPQRKLGFSAPVAQSGASWVRQRDGRTHVVFSLDSAATYSRQVSTDFTDARMIYDDDSTCVCVNLATGASSRYSNWYFNSYATIDGEEYGCDGDGLRLLEGADDQGAPILSAVDCGRVGYGSIQIKAPECAYVAGKSANPLVIDIRLPNGATYSYEARTQSDTPAIIRHDGMKGLMNMRQTWFSTVIRNDAGGGMEVSGVEVLINESPRRI